MYKLKDRIKKETASLKFTNDTIEHFLQPSNCQITQFANVVDFSCVSERGSLKFFIQKDNGFKVKVIHSFAKVFDFGSDAVLTEAQIDRLQSFADKFLKENPIEKKTLIGFKPILVQGNVRQAGFI